MAVIDEQMNNVLYGQDISALLELIDDQGIAEEQRPDIILGALRQLEGLFYEQLPDLVVRLCVEMPEAIADGIRYFFMRPWLERDGYHYRGEIIAQITNRLQNMDGDHLISAIKTAWVVGYRDDALQTELVRIADLQRETHYEESAQGYALAVLSDLAYPDAKAITEALESRLQRIGYLTEPDCWTAIRAASPDMIPALRNAAASESVAVYALLEIATQYPDKAEDVWGAFSSLTDRAKMGHVGNATDRIDLEDVGSYLLSEVMAAFEHHIQHNLLPPVGQFIDANLPNHIKVFRSQRRLLVADQLDSLQCVAIPATGNSGMWQTVQTLDKKAAWDVILRLGLDEARKWLPAAMEGEVNFTRVELGEIASFLQIAEAVAPLANTVKDETTYIGIGVGCLRCLGVIGTEEALQALLESKVHIKQGEKRSIPMTLVEALASACMTLRSCESVWRLLANSNAEREMREACAYVIEELSTISDAPLPSIDEVIRLMRTEGQTLPGYDPLLLFLARFAEVCAVEATTVLDFLRELGDSTYESPKLTFALAIVGLLNQFPARIERIGIMRVEDRWTLTKPLDDFSALALLDLYRSDPTNFESALSEALAGSVFSPAAQIVANLKSKDDLLPSVRQALWDRACRWNGPNKSDRSSLEAVARTGPEALLEDATITKVSQWSSSARRAYLAALRTALSEHGSGNVIAQIACQFLVDDDNGVRQDAARLARDSDPAALQQAVDRFAARVEELDQAVFMLDAAFWLETNWNQYAVLGRANREPLVRKLAERLSRENAARLLARKYLPLILESRDYLDTWCYGQALLELGDEDTLTRLYAEMPAEVYRRAYQIWLAKELDKRIEKRRRADHAELPPPVSQEHPMEIYVELDGERLGPYKAIFQQSQIRRAHTWTRSWSLRIANEPDLAQRLNARTGSDDYIYIESSEGFCGYVLPIRSYVNSGDVQTSAQVRLLGLAQSQTTSLELETEFSS